VERTLQLDIEDFPIMRHWFVVHRRGKRLSAAAGAFREFMLREAGKLLGYKIAAPAGRRKR
jgi:hypothetical protein